MESKMRSVQAVLGLLVCLIGLTVCTQYTDCGSKGGTIKAITVPGCNKGPCILKKGTNVSIEMDFTAKKNIDKVTTKITALIGRMRVPFNPDDSNACHFMKCPIKKGDTAKYTQNLPILATYPTVDLKVQWELRSKGKDVTCFRLSARLQ